MAITAKGVTPLLEVFDVRRSMAFYRDIIGFEVLQTWEPEGHLYWVMLRLGNAVLMLNARYEDDERPPEPDVHLASSHADTELFFDCPSVREAYGQLRAKGVPVDEPQITHYGAMQVWLTDPDGFKLCFQQPLS